MGGLPATEPGALETVTVAYKTNTSDAFMTGGSSSGTGMLVASGQTSSGTGNLWNLQVGGGGGSVYAGAVVSNITSPNVVISETAGCGRGTFHDERCRLRTDHGLRSEPAARHHGPDRSAGATFDLGGGTQTVASLTDYTPGQSGTIQNSSATPSVLTIASTGGSATFGGLIAGGGSLGSLGLTWSGAGLLNLAGPNTYTGGTTIAAGTLQNGQRFRTGV